MTTKTNRVPKPRKKKTSEKKQHRVYCTYFPDNRYYIGYSGKTDKLFEKYYGSSKLVTEYKGQLEKEVILITPNKNDAKMQEFLLQWQCRRDVLCLNDMIHLRLRLKYLESFNGVVWSPRHSSDCFVGTIRGKYQIRE